VFSLAGIVSRMTSPPPHPYEFNLICEDDLIRLIATISAISTELSKQLSQFLNRVLFSKSNKGIIEAYKELEHYVNQQTEYARDDERASISFSLSKALSLIHSMDKDFTELKKIMK